MIQQKFIDEIMELESGAHKSIRLSDAGTTLQDFEKLKISPFKNKVSNPLGMI